MTLLDSHANPVPAWYGDLPVTSRYTYGIAAERFFRAIQEDAKIIGTYCPSCDHTYVPAVMFCERCLAELDEWVDVGTSGTVHTFTVLHRNYVGSHAEQPRIVAFIRFGDGGLVHTLQEVDPSGVSIGMNVEAVFKPQSERAGSILDISHFQPI